MFGSHARSSVAKRTTARIQPTIEGLEGRVVLSTFKVNTTLDTVAVNLNNGKDANGNISLRSAIQAANARAGSDTIIASGPNSLITCRQAPQGAVGVAVGV